MKVKLSNVRLAFPQLFKATNVNGEGDPSFSASFIMVPNHPSLALIDAAIEQVARAKWGLKFEAILKAARTADKVAIHSGESKVDYAGYEGNFFISARSKTRPLVLDANRSPLVEEDGRPYAGCYVNAIVEIWAQDNNYGKRINASLSAVQFHRDGEAFAGGAAASQEDFDDVSAGANAEDFV